MTDPSRIEKLIRDTIPDLMDEAGRRDLRRVTDAEIAPHVALKVLEEALEVHEAALLGDRPALIEEVADLQEVLHRLMTLHGIDPADVTAARHAKNARRGAFLGNWLLALDAGQRRDRSRIWTGPADRFIEALEREFATCERASLAVAFGMASSLPLVGPALDGALRRGARIRLLTSDTLDVTEPAFLDAMLARAPGLELRLHHEPGRSFHPKAYLFEHPDGRRVAYLGSSNLSRSALVSGIEWNVRLQDTDAGWPVQDLLDRFEAMWQAPTALRIDRDWISAYAARRQPRPATTETVELPTPNAPQREALAALRALREQGETRALVIAATGIGKTYLAAFASRQARRVLFVAHREELLRQARDTFARVRPDATCGFIGMGKFEPDADLVFASVATLARPEHLARLAPDAFDYIVVDEVHHGTAPSYRTLLHHFAPEFLLGLTATPYRADHRDVFGLCDGNVAYRIGMLEAIAFGWLAPFHYRGILDPTDYAAVPWRNGRYDEEALSTAVETRLRAELALQAFREHPTTAALGFCVSIRHAEFMARTFREQGVPAIAVHSGPGAVDRQEAIARLRSGQVRILFTVDLFNEGVDIPEVDGVLFLRPTESPTVFLQQLGRGLRLHPGKPELKVLDLVGNHRGVHRKFPLLLGLDEEEVRGRKLTNVLEAVARQEYSLPPGVRIDLDLQVIDVLAAMARRGEPRRDAMLEDFQELATSLGHPPTLLEVHRLGRFSVRTHLQEFGSWNGFLGAAGSLDSVDRANEARAGAFLTEVEKTSMTRSFKMVVLEALVRRGGLRQPVAIEDLAEDFRRFFVEDPRHARDLQGDGWGNIGAVPAGTWRAHMLKNPVAVWTGTGKAGDASFTVEGERLRYVGPRPDTMEAFERAVLERVAWRLGQYFERRYERRNVFNVIHAQDRGIVMLGDDAPVPRDRDWVPVTVGDRTLWARFAKIALNVLKEEPSEAAPNVLTRVLEGWFGPEGFRSDRRNRVRIEQVEDGSWAIAPVGRGVR